MGLNSVAPNQYVSNDNGFAHPRFGGNLATMRGSILFTDSTVVTLFTLPAGAVVIDYWYDIVTESNASATGTIDVGLSTNPDGYVDAGDVTSLGRVRAGANSTDLITALNNTPLTEPTEVHGVYAESGDAADQGEFVFHVLYTRETISS